MKGMGLDDDAMREIEAAILAAPDAHPMIKGLRGARKARFPLPGRGKSGGGRTIYYVAVAPGTLFMMSAYPKNERDNLCAGPAQGHPGRDRQHQRRPSAMSRRAPAKASAVKGSPVGADLVEAFREMAAYLRGEVEAESYEVSDDVLTPQRVKAIGARSPAATKEFERRFRISARTMEAYEQGRRRPDAAMQTLLASSSASRRPCGARLRRDGNYRRSRSRIYS